MTASSPMAVLMQADVCQMPESDTSYSNSRFFLGCDILNDWASAGHFLRFSCRGLGHKYGLKDIEAYCLVSSATRLDLLFPRQSPWFLLPNQLLKLDIPDNYLRSPSSFSQPLPKAPILISKAVSLPLGFLGGSVVKNVCQCRSLISELGKSPGEGNGNLLQYSCLGNPWTEEPGGLQSMGWPRGGCDWATEHTHIRKTTCDLIFETPGGFLQVMAELDLNYPYI